MSPGAIRRVFVECQQDTTEFQQRRERRRHDGQRRHQDARLLEPPDEQQRQQFLQLPGQCKDRITRWITVEQRQRRGTAFPAEQFGCVAEPRFGIAGIARERLGDAGLGRVDVAAQALEHGEIGGGRRVARCGLERAFHRPPGAGQIAQPVTGDAEVHPGFGEPGRERGGARKRLGRTLQRALSRFCEAARVVCGSQAGRAQRGFAGCAACAARVAEREQRGGQVQWWRRVAGQQRGGTAKNLRRLACPASGLKPDAVVQQRLCIAGRQRDGAGKQRHAGRRVAETDAAQS
ncbi:MAG: hypothetical protein U1E70_07545 [Acetobacteraceae bacterium]